MKRTLVLLLLAVFLVAALAAPALAASTGPSITTQPKNYTGPVGDTATFKVVASGTGLTYQWYCKKTGESSFAKSTLSSATSATLSLTLQAKHDGYQYYCKVKDSSGNTVNSNTVKVIIGTPLKITTQPKNYTGAVGTTAKFNVAAAGDGLTYQWYYKTPSASSFSKCTSAPGTTANYSIAVQAKHDGYQFYCIVKDSHGNSVQTNTVKIFVGTPLKITTQPSNFTGAVGATAKLKVVAQGDGLTYQWYCKKTGESSFAKSTLSSATSATLSLTLQAKHDGYQYYCKVKDSHGSTVNSNTVKITVGTPLKITTQPSNYTGAVGSTAKLKVVAQGDGLTYQWYCKKTGESSFAKSTLSSATTATLSLTVQAKHDGYQYYCKVKDSSGSTVNSNTVKITVGTPLKITTQPSNYTGAVGSTAKLKVVAQGDGLTYQWYCKKTGETSFTKSTLSSATSATLSLTLQAKHDGYQYYCKVKDSHGNSVNSNTVKITVGTPLKITTQPANFTGAAGSTATFKVVAQGDGLTYQWYYKKYGASSFVKSTLASGTKATYSMTVANRHDEWQYYCIVKDSYGNSVKSDTVKISVGSPLQIVSQSPQHMTVAVGDNLYIFVEAEGDVLTYQWYYKSATASGFSKSTAESGTTYRYSTEVQAKHDGWQYYCIVKDIHGNSIKSDVFTVSVGETSLRRDQNTSADVTGHIGEPAVFTVAAEGDGLTYQWYYKKAGSDTFAKSTLACAKTDTYSTTIQEKYDGWQYYCVVTDRYGSSLNSRVARLSVGNPLRITTDLNTNYCSAVGYPLTFHVAAEGDGLSYQWYSTTADPDNYGYKPVPEASGKTDTFTHVLTEYDKSTSMRVYCVVTDSHGTSVQSYNPVVLVVPPMSITSQTEQARFDSENGETVQLSVTAYGGDTNKTCQWHFIRKLGKQETDTEVDGEISNTYYGSSNATYTASLPGRYYCVITDGQGNSVTSEEITVVKKIYIITQPTGGSLTVAQPTVDMGLAYGGGLDPLTYQWYHDGNAIPDATDRMYSAAEAGSYYCIVRDAFGDSARTDTVQVTDERDMKVTRQPVGGALPTGSQGLYVDIAVTGGDGSYVYKFYRDGSLQSTKTVNYTYIHDAGQWYIVVQDGSGRSVQSNTFLVRPELQITQQPEGGSIESAGSSVALSVTAADGAPPYTYQWLKNGENISGATYRTYTAASAGNYSVKVTDSAGSWVISDTAVVTETLHITAEPEDKWIKATDSTTLSIGVSGGTGTVTCQWQRYTGNAWTNFKTGASINVDGTQFGTYRCVVSDSAGAELISRSVTVAEDVLRIDQKKVVLEGGTQNPYRYYFHVTGGAGGYYSERVYVYTYNWFNWTGELDRITDETGTWFVSSYCYGGDFKVVIHIMDTEGNYVRDFINCTESDIPNTYLHW